MLIDRHPHEDVFARVPELAEETTADGMQRLLSTAHWDADAVRDDLVQYVLEHLRDPQAVLVLDETGFPKKGTKSVGVAPQYCGAVGKICNCQIGVFLAYATAQGPVLLDRELYLPQEWTSDPARCQEAGVPAGKTTVPKSTQGKQLLERAFVAGVQADWVTADSIYGGDGKLCRFLEDRLQAFVLAVPSSHWIGLAHRADAVVAQAPVEAWHRLSAEEGSQGPRLYDWVWMRMGWRWSVPGWAHWLLARRSLSKPDEITYYLVFAPETVTLPEVVQVAGTRWQVEDAFELAKGEVGLDEYEVRHWVGWYRHITLAMLALAYLTVVKVQARKKGRLGSKKASG